MVLQFQELERKLAALPVAEQAQWIEHFLEELHAQAGATSAEAIADVNWIAGRKHSPRDISVVIDQLRQFRHGKLLGEDLNLGDLIDEGRRV